MLRVKCFRLILALDPQGSARYVFSEFSSVITMWPSKNPLVLMRRQSFVLVFQPKIMKWEVCCIRLDSGLLLFSGRVPKFWTRAPHLRHQLNAIVAFFKIKKKFFFFLLNLK